MNDDTDKPLNPVGDDALEARITAWVLGEASPFEAAELEDLCANRPEVRLIARRLRVLHGLIGGDASSGSDDAWKLPPEKRAKIEALFGAVAEVPISKREEVIAPTKRRGGGGRRALLALAACTVVSVTGWVMLQQQGGLRVGHGREVSFAAEERDHWANSPTSGKAETRRNREVPMAPAAESPSALLDLESDARSALRAPDFDASPPPSHPAIAMRDLGKDVPAEQSGLEDLDRQLAQNDFPDDDPFASSESAASRRAAGGLPGQQGGGFGGGARQRVVGEKENAGVDTGSLQSEGGVGSFKQEAGGESLAMAGQGQQSASGATSFEYRDSAGEVIVPLGRDDLPIVGGLFPTDEFGNAEAGSGGAKSETGPQEHDGSYSGLAAREQIRRQDAVATSDRLRDEGREAYSKGDYKQAVDRFRESLEVLPDAPMVQERRDYLGELFADGAAVLGEQQRRVGKYDEARQLADEALSYNKNGEEAKKLAENPDDSIRYNPALSYENAENVGDVRSRLYTAEGNINLGKYDDANAAYEEVLRIDPYNQAARRGMEQVAAARADYYRAAYDHTRAELLAEVDRAWELRAAEGAKQGDIEIIREFHYSEEYQVPEAPISSSDVKSLEVFGAEADSKSRGNTPAEEGRILNLVETPLISPTAPVEEPELKNNTEPTPGFVDSVAETPTATEPISTFSLHIGDASFKLAKAALDRGEVPAAESIRPEEFYNAFDYGDPSPAAGEPVAGVVEQSAHPAVPQRNLLRIGVRAGSQGRGQSTPLNLTLLVDSSGSMEREDRQAGLANAVRQLSSLLKEGDTVSVIGFSRQPRTLVQQLPGSRAAELNTIIAQTPSEGGTNLEEGLRLAEEQALQQFNPAAQNRVVLFTDGAANLGGVKPEALQARIGEMRQRGVAFDAAGFGAEGLNDMLLERLTRNGNGRYHVVDSAAEADDSFARQLAGAFRPAAENVKVQVKFNPARVARYKLIGFEEHRLKTEDFRDDSVDAAEMAAEEAGNALYQIEVLPQGEGEVGEVSVRFRDAASGRMEERTWTIPYDAQAPAFDRASPSIQLAGLAALAAEKLRGAPVDFDGVAPVLAHVKARYPGSQPVAHLESMIGKLK